MINNNQYSTIQIDKKIYLRFKRFCKKNNFQIKSFATSIIINAISEKNGKEQ